MDSFYFFCDSDLHFKKRDNNIVTLYDYKANNVQRIINSNADFVLVAGDITNNGSDGKKILCIPISGPEKQLQAYMSHYVEPIESYGIKVYSCLGNHDNWTYPPYIHKAIVNFIKKKHGGLLYNFVNKSVQFICLSIYPDKTSLKYFSKVADKSKPIVVFFNYNLEGEVSGSWSNEEKQAFKNTINGYNIKLIVTGHLHEAWAVTWNGYPVIICGGMGVYKCYFDADTQSISVEQIV